MLKNKEENHHTSPVTRVCALALPMVFISSLSYADSSFLLQIGMFETQSEAMGKWSEVKAANADVLQGLEGHVAEVMLPSDTAPSYRMQIGPVASRREAKSLCKQLEKRNVDCLLVETAFAASDLSPEMAGDVSNPAPLSATVTNIPSEPKAPLEAQQPEDRIAAETLPPVEAQAAAANDTPQTIASAAPPMRHSANINNRYKGYSNPNDAKKPGFFRGAFRFNDGASTESAEAPVNAPVSETPPPPVQIAAKQEDDSPGFFGRLFGRSKPKPERTETVAPIAQGDVEVSEAIRVPVSSQVEIVQDAATNPDNQSVPIPSILPVALNMELDRGLYWAQIRYFKTQSKAKAFYERLQMADGLEKVPFKAHYSHSLRANKERTALRIGPFASQSDVNLACASAKKLGLRCAVIHEEKNYASKSDNAASRKSYPSPLEAVGLFGSEAPPSSTAPAAGRVDSAPATSIPVVASQWITLGNFPTSQDAFDHWRTLQSKVPVLQSIKPTITGMLGGGNERFQLRAGPFDTDVDAESTCKLLVERGNSCAMLEVK